MKSILLSIIVWNSLLFSQSINNFKFTTHNPSYILTDTLSFYQQKDSWQQIIDDYWGAGLPLAEKREVFNLFADYLEHDFPCFSGLNLTWGFYRFNNYSRINETTSKGEFHSILSFMAWDLNDPHLYAWDDDLRITDLNPGTPLLALGYPFINHFGAELTPLPDSSLLVYRVIENHPLSLQPGDVVLGYEGIPWKKLVFEFLESKVPMISICASTPSSRIHQILQSAGDNWHLFNSIDVIKYETGDTLQLLTKNLLNIQLAQMEWKHEQMDIPGITKPDFNSKWEVPNGVSYGILDSNVGYIAVSKHSYEGMSNDFTEAFNDLLNTNGLILDFRKNAGGYTNESINDVINKIADFNSFTLDVYTRESPDLILSLIKEQTNINLDWYIQGEGNSEYTNPIALLVGPNCVSMGEITAYRLKKISNVESFGKSTEGGFSGFFKNNYNKSYRGFSLSRPTRAVVDYFNPTELLARKEFPVDHYVWLEKDDVAKGDDTVVDSALAWIKNKIDPVGIDKNGSELLAKDFVLHQNYPNPFNPSTIIKYSIPVNEKRETKNVKMIVFDILGREVATLVNQKQKPGNYKVAWNAKDQPSGVYFYRLNAGEYNETRKMILLR